ncbi:hypothetical protein NGUA15_00076 [Salmonella enterica]|nr:hypothetical protein NGUA15_00076 [Salmonella enterica]
MRNLSQSGFNFRQSAGFQELIRHPGIFQHGDITGGVLILLRGAKELQRSPLAAFIFDTGRGA